MCPSTRRRSFPVVASVYLFSLLFLAVPFVAAQAGEGVQGTWEGAMQLPSMELAVVVEFRVVDGTLEGDIDIPAQGAKDLPLGDISFEGSALRFKIQGVPGDPTFDGSLAEDGETISGTFSQAGQDFPFHLARKGSESDTDAATDPEDDPLEGYAEFVEQSRAAWMAPGVAVAVVRDGKIVHIEGYGCGTSTRNCR